MVHFEVLIPGVILGVNDRMIKAQYENDVALILYLFTVWCVGRKPVIDNIVGFMSVVKTPWIEVIT